MRESRAPFIRLLELINLKALNMSDNSPSCGRVLALVQSPSRVRRDRATVDLTFQFDSIGRRRGVGCRLTGANITNMSICILQILYWGIKVLRNKQVPDLKT